MLVIIIILIPVTQSNNNSVSYDDISKISKFDNGSTVYAGDQVIDKNNVNKYPTVSNLGYLFGQIGSGDLITSFFSVATGAVPIPATDIVVGNVTDGGVVEDFEGPGHIEITNNTIKVIAPDDLIYGYLTPYYQAVKTSTGVDIVNNKTILFNEYTNIKSSLIFSIALIALLVKSFVKFFIFIKASNPFPSLIVSPTHKLFAFFSALLTSETICSGVAVLFNKMQTTLDILKPSFLSAFIFILATSPKGLDLKL